MRYELFAAFGSLSLGKLPVVTSSLALLCLLLGAGKLPAQSFPKLEAAANQAFAKGQFAEAASLFEQAARLRQNHAETMAQAAECYYLLRDYAKSAECYALAEPALGKNDLTRLRYGRSLKQAGHPTEAMNVFRQLAATYTAADRETIIAIADLEISGCQLAIDFAQKQTGIGHAGRVIRLSDSLNSLQNELAPIRWSDDVLYFFTKARGRTDLMRSLRSDGQWQPPQLATGLPTAIQSDLGSGTLAPDGRRFYCTRCPEDDPATGVYPPCVLYVTRRLADGPWGEPERLRDYINLPETTILTPFITCSADREWLFFASNRPGGFGGLDLYSCERPLDADDLDFSFPQNLGPLVNSAGDDLSPYFDPASATLWFSSNGHISMGGLDIFRTQAIAGGWTSPQHLDYPINSEADDLFFVPERAGAGGMLVSNRLFGAAKNSTRHNDLFEIQPLR